MPLASFECHWAFYLCAHTYLYASSFSIKLNIEEDERQRELQTICQHASRFICLLLTSFRHINSSHTHTHTHMLMMTPTDRARSKEEANISFHVQGKKLYDTKKTFVIEIYLHLEECDMYIAAWEEEEHKIIAERRWILIGEIWTHSKSIFSSFFLTAALSIFLPAHSVWGTISSIFFSSSKFMSFNNFEIEEGNILTDFGLKIINSLSNN